MSLSLTSHYLLRLVHAATGVLGESEYRFHPRRKWRFDLAWPSVRVAVEIDGGVFRNGRHVRGTGFLLDMEKLNAAVLLGWIVLRYTPDQVLGGKAAGQIVEMVERRMVHS